jgi:hypothetical protein
MVLRGAECRFRASFSVGDGWEYDIPSGASDLNAAKLHCTGSGMQQLRPRSEQSAVFRTRRGFVSIRHALNCNVRYVFDRARIIERASGAQAVDMGLARTRTR